MALRLEAGRLIISKNLDVREDILSGDKIIAFRCVDCKKDWNAKIDRHKLQTRGFLHWSMLLESDTHCPKCLAEQKEASR